MSRSEAETALRESMDAAVAAGDYTTAMVAAGRLADLLKDTGQLVEAVQLGWQRIHYAEQAGLGPWTELNSRVALLQALNRLYQNDDIQARRILGEVSRLRDQMAALPAVPGPDEAVTAWNTREGLLDTGRNAAVQLGRWADALDLNAVVLASMRGRSAPATIIARSRFNDYAPLLRLDRTEEALALLQACLRTFQEAGDNTLIGNALSALADTESFRDHGEAAVRLEHDALRYRYRAQDVTGIATSYHNLGMHHGLHTRQFASALACHLAAALIGYVTWSGDVHGSVPFAARGVLELRGRAVLPASVAALGDQIGDIPGTNLPLLIAKLFPDPAGAERALRDLITRVSELAATGEPS